MLDWLINKLEEHSCKHDWIVTEKWRGTNGFGLIGYRTYYQCRKCLKQKYTDYYP